MCVTCTRCTIPTTDFLPTGPLTRTAFSISVSVKGLEVISWRQSLMIPQSLLSRCIMERHKASEGLFIPGNSQVYCGHAASSPGNWSLFQAILDYSTLLSQTALATWPQL